MKRISLLSALLLAVGAAVAAAAAGSPAPVNEAQAVAFARAVDLTAADLPGAQELSDAFQEPGAEEREARRAQSRLLRCARPGAFAHKPVYRSVSALAYGDWIVGAAVVVMPSRAIATDEIGVFASARGHACFARGAQPIVGSANEPPLPPKPLRTVFIRLATLLGRGAIGVHTLSRQLRGARTDDVVFRVGTAEIEFVAFGKRQFPSATEVGLLRLLHARAEAAAGRL